MGSIDRYELQTGHRGTPFFLLILTAGKSSGWGGAGEVRVGGVVEGGGEKKVGPAINFFSRLRDGKDKHLFNYLCIRILIDES